MSQVKVTQKLLQAKTQQGFTLLEVLVAVVLLLVFTSVAMNGLAIAAALKIRARVNTVATAWIQEDLEAVKYASAQLAYTLSADAAAGQTNLTLVSTVGLVNGEQITVGTDPNIYVIQSIAGNSVTLTSKLSLAQTASAKVVSVSKCNATTANAGFAYDLQQKLPALSRGGSSTLAGKPYTLSRNAVISSTAPFEILRLTYSVTPQAGGTAAATMYTEVIPNAIYACPKQQ